MSSKQFPCKRCGYNFNTKEHLVRHLNRKKICDPIIEDLDCDLLISELTTRTGNYTCALCDAKFKHSSSLYRHKGKCRIKGSNDRDDELTKIKAEVKELRELLSKKECGNTTNNTTNNTNNGTINNIHINAMGREDITYLTELPMFRDFMTQCIKDKKYGLMNFIEHRNFHPEHPENHNMRKLIKNDDFIHVYDVQKKEWMPKIVEDVLDEVCIYLRNEFAIFIEDELYEEDGKLKKIWVDNFMKEVGTPLGWDLSTEDHSFEPDPNISEDKRKEMKDKLYNLASLYVYNLSKKLFSAK